MILRPCARTLAYITFGAGHLHSVNDESKYEHIGEAIFPHLADFSCGNLRQ
jgi:hypothetical protein